MDALAEGSPKEIPCDWRLLGGGLFWATALGEVE